MRERWAADISERCKAYWTESQTHGQFGSKNLILPPADYGPLLRSMGLLKADGSMSPDSVRKYMQISHMLTLLEPYVRTLAESHPVVRILDLACGNSYLTLVLAASIAQRISHPAEILGVDRNERLIQACRERAWRLQLDSSLRFEASLINHVNLRQTWERSFPTSKDPAPHMVVALHACDTATDDAIALGLATKADLIAVVPCCQAELARKWAARVSNDPSSPLNPVWIWPHMRRELGATVTDLLRTLLLKACGYDAYATEFVPSNHTPKNTMIRAQRTDDVNPERMLDYLRVRSQFGGESIHLEELLPPALRKNLIDAATSLGLGQTVSLVSKED